jgi:hypothetical protein
LNKDDAGMLNVCEQLAEGQGRAVRPGGAEELTTVISVSDEAASARRAHKLDAGRPRRRGEQQAVRARRRAATRGQSTAARRMLRGFSGAGEESCAVWWERPYKDRFMDRLLLLANVVNGV